MTHPRKLSNLKRKSWEPPFYSLSVRSTGENLDLQLVTTCSGRGREGAILWNWVINLWDLCELQVVSSLDFRTSTWCWGGWRTGWHGENPHTYVVRSILFNNKQLYTNNFSNIAEIQLQASLMYKHRYKNLKYISYQNKFIVTIVIHL